MLFWNLFLDELMLNAEFFKNLTQNSGILSRDALVLLNVDVRTFKLKREVNTYYFVHQNKF